MSDILKLIQQRLSTRVPFDPDKPVSKEDLEKIVEAGRWAPTAHNMQNFEIIVIDDKATLKKVGSIKSRISEAFIRENYEQLSFSEQELRKKKVGIMGAQFPPDWRDPNKFDDAIRNSVPSPLSETMRGSPAILVVTYDPGKRAPASEGDVLGMFSLGCVMENMWLMAQSLGVGFMIMSVFSGEGIEKELKKALKIPAHLKIAYACRLGYPVAKPKYVRVRRDIKDLTHHNTYGNKGLD
jgi:nitroreductase